MIGLRLAGAFHSPSTRDTHNQSLRMTACPQSRTKPSRFRSPGTNRRPVSGHRKRSSPPAVRRLKPASAADLLPSRPSLRPEAPSAHHRPTPAVRWPGPRSATFKAADDFARSESFVECTNVRIPIPRGPWNQNYRWRKMLLNTKYMADATFPREKDKKDK